jgi:hypothetical protein
MGVTAARRVAVSAMAGEGRYASAARSAAPWELFLGDAVRCGPGSTHLSTVIRAAGTASLWGARKRGLGGNLEPGRLGAPRGAGFPPVHFPIGPPFCLFTRGVEP